MVRSCHPRRGPWRSTLRALATTSTSCLRKTPQLACIAVSTFGLRSSVVCPFSCPTRPPPYPSEDWTAAPRVPRRTPQSYPTKATSTGRPTLAV
eukprot:4112140-Pleurochrysis_carterae.AAC.1